jgi:hypothetical protein
MPSRRGLAEDVRYVRPGEWMTVGLERFRGGLGGDAGERR